MESKIIQFLVNNEFNYIEENHYANDFCGVVYDKDNPNSIVIANNAGQQWFIAHDLYSVVGVLVYHSFINRNFNF